MNLRTFLTHMNSDIVQDSNSHVRQLQNRDETSVGKYEAKHVLCILDIPEEFIKYFSKYLIKIYN